jgi:quinol monooxygenase YgiN
MMLIVVARMNAQAGKEEEMEKALLEIIPKVEAEEGTLAYALHRMKKKPQKFLMYEKYTDKEALTHHSSTPYFAELFGKIAPLMDGDPVIEVYEMLSSIKEKG